jgi:hypothetical protein
MNQPEQIIRTLDQHLVKPTRLILYGRAALALGYPEPQHLFQSTMDVDAILPEVEMAAIESDDSFWEAIQKTNDQLFSSGLYLTHLFVDSQIVLRPDWLDHIVPIHLQGLRHLTLFRPATEDFILTKMMRVDPQDRSDIEFLLGNASLDPDKLARLLKSARIPDIPEIYDAFEENSAWLQKRIGGNHKLNS